MVSLTMMARLLEAVRPEQPADPGRRPVPARLGRGRRGARRPGRRPYRSATDVGVAALRHLAPVRRVDRLARRGGARRATPTARSRCCEAGGDHVELVDVARPGGPRPSAGRSRTPWTSCAPPRPATPTARWRLLDRQRLLCAHREGPYGVRHWNRQVERWLGEETGEPIWSRAGTPAGRCWSPPTTTASASTTATPASWSVRRARPAARCALHRRQRRPARPRHRPARPGRDDARDDDPQEPGQPGRRGRRAAARRRSPGCSPASSSTPRSPAPASACVVVGSRGRRTRRHRPPGPARHRAAAAARRRRSEP